MRYILAVLLLLAFTGCQSLTQNQVDLTLALMDKAVEHAEKSGLDYDAELVLGDSWAVGATPFTVKTPVSGRVRFTGRFGQ